MCRTVVLASSLLAMILILKHGGRGTPSSRAGCAAKGISGAFERISDVKQQTQEKHYVLSPVLHVTAGVSTPAGSKTSRS